MKIIHPDGLSFLRVSRKIPSFFCGILVLLIISRTANGQPGVWDPTYTPAIPNGAVYALGLQGDGKLVVGGAFKKVGNSTSNSFLARLFSDGTLDTTFSTGAEGLSATVWCLAVDTDGHIVIGGDFEIFNNNQQNVRPHIARLNANGALDGSFLPTNTINNSVFALAIQTNHAVIIGGAFSQGAFPSYLARLNADGSTDTSFGGYPNGAIYAIAIQTDGKIVIGGNFETVDGATRRDIARLNPDGSLDTTFQNGLAGSSSSVRCVQIQSDGKILIGGDFTMVNTSYRNYVARLNTDGSTDAGFTSSPGANGSVYALALQPDNNIIIGGAFTTYDLTNHNYVARLYPDGTLDTSFTNSAFNGKVQALAIQSDSRILAGGGFTAVGNTKLSYLARLYGDLYPPDFVVQPADCATNVGGSVTFSAEVNNPTAVSFQWSKDGNDIVGATGNSYSIFNVQFADAGNYSVFVTDTLGSTTSSNALLQVGIAPAFTRQASSLVVTQGQSASFAVTATGTPLNYLWQKNGAFLSSQTNSSLNFDSVAATNVGVYTCQVSNFISSITSTGAVLTVISPNSTLSASLGAGPNVNLSLIGAPGGNYILETATNLLAPIQWVPVLTNAADSNGVWQFTDTNLSNAQLFYRVTKP